MTRSNDLKLKGCPFCGSDTDCRVEPLAVDDETLEPEDQTVIGWGVGCQCTAFVGSFSTEIKAITAWNTRHTPDREAVAKLLCEISDDDWSQGKRFWRCQADRVIALMEGKQ